MPQLKQIGRDHYGRPIMARGTVTKAVAQKWIATGRAEFAGWMREAMGQAFGVLNVYASASKPGYTCHYRDPEQDGRSSTTPSDIARALGSRGGSANTPAQNAARAENGGKGDPESHRRGGRPKGK
jgi:hypothetical protein